MPKTKSLFVYLIIISNTFAESMPGTTLLNYFKSSCNSIGGYTQAALSESQALMQTLESLKNDENCKSVAGAISQLSNLNRTLAILDEQYSHEVDIAKLEAQEIELLSQISRTSDPLTLDQLNASIQQVQINKAAQVAEDKFRSKYDGHGLKNVYSQIIASTSAAYGAIASNQLCLDSNPGVLTSATSLMSSIAASSILINPALGLGLGGLSDFIGNTIGHYRDRGLNSSIRFIANKSTIPVGLLCALETLNRRQCDIQDAKDFLKIERDIRSEQDQNHDNDSDLSKLKRISDIFDKDLPVFLGWLEKVKSGAPASNTADAELRSKILMQETKVRIARSLGEGLFSENSELFTNAQNDEAKWTILKEIISILIDQLPSPYMGNSPGSIPSPLGDIYDSRYAPYYLLGLSKDMAPKMQGSSTYEEFSSFNPFSLDHAHRWQGQKFVPNLSLLISQYNEWLILTDEKVKQKLVLMLQPDALTIFADYSHPTSNSLKRSPEQGLSNIIQFLNDHISAANGNPIVNNLFITTISRLEKIQAATEVAKIPFILPVNCNDYHNQSISNAKCNPYKKAIEKIFTEAQLEFGSLVLKNRLEASIRIAIYHIIKLAKENSENENQMAQLLAANSFLDVLKKVSGKDTMTAIKEDLDTAESVTNGNLESFGRSFGFHINSIFLNSQRDFNSTDPDIAYPVEKMRAKMCFLLAAIPNWPISVRQNYCNGLKLSNSDSGIDSIEFSKSLMNSGLGKRRCLYRDFQRKADIFEQWNIKL